MREGQAVGRTIGASARWAKQAEEATNRRDERRSGGTHDLAGADVGSARQSVNGNERRKQPVDVVRHGEFTRQERTLSADRALAD